MIVKPKQLFLIIVSGLVLFAAVLTSGCDAQTKKIMEADHLPLASRIFFAFLNLIQKKPEFSTMPKTLKFPTQTFSIPRNYFSPRGGNDPEEKEADYFGFYLFLPDFEGFTPERAKFYPEMKETQEQIVYVSEVSEPGKVLIQDGKSVPLWPSAWGDPKATFEEATKGFELLREEHGLKCYGLKSWIGLSNALPCIGTRSNGELLFMRARDEPEVSGISYTVDVKYYSEREQLYVRYRYSKRNHHRWREIDDAVWGKIRAWRVK